MRAIVAIPIVAAALMVWPLGQRRAAPAAEASDQPPTPTRLATLDNPLFVFGIGRHDSRYRSPEAKAKLLAELGFDGMAQIGLDDIPRTLAALDRFHLRLYAVYTAINLDPEQPPFDPKLLSVIDQLAGRETIIWLHTQGRLFEPSSPKGDRRAVKIIRHLADRAARHDLRIALYPHDGLWLQTTDDAVRVAARTGRYNVGVTFNLCHWMKSRPRPPFDAVLHRAMPRLMLMTINGADSDSRRWSDLIRPLGQGDFPIENLLVTLDQMEYDGPIGLQTYGILGDERARLARSIEVWRELTGRVSGQTDGDRPVTEPRRDERISDGQEGEEEDPDAQPARPEAAPTVGRGAQAGG